MHQLAVNIIYRWHKSIAEDYNRDPFTEAEMLILSPTTLSAYQIGKAWVYPLLDGNTRTIKTSEVVPLFKEVKVAFGGGLKGEII